MICLIVGTWMTIEFTIRSVDQIVALFGFTIWDLLIINLIV